MKISLWLTQNLKLEIWDRHIYDLYLNIYHNTTIDKSLNPKFNRDILLVPTNVLMYSHGDCDNLNSVTLNGNIHDKLI